MFTDTGRVQVELWRGEYVHAYYQFLVITIISSGRYRAFVELRLIREKPLNRFPPVRLIDHL